MKPDRIEGRVGGAGRKAWIDALRAVPMLLVLLGHILKGANGFHLFASPVKLPLFFAISGYLFREDRPAGAFLKGLARRLLAPWLIAFAGMELAKAVLRRGIDLAAVAGDVLPEPLLWYIPCLLLAELLWYAAGRALRGDAARAIGALALSAAGFWMARRGALDALMLNRAFIAQFYFLVGWAFRRLEGRARALPVGAILAGAAVYVLLGVVSLRLWPGSHIDVHMNRYDHIPFDMLMVVVGCATLMALFARLDLAPRPLVFIGQNTLIYYMSGNLVMKGLQRGLSMAGIKWSVNVQAAALILPICVLCGLLSLAVNRFLPELAGRRRAPRA